MRSKPNGPSLGALAVVLLALGCPSRTETVPGGSDTTRSQTAPAAQACDSARTQVDITACQTRAATDAEAEEDARYARAVDAIKQKGTAEQSAALANGEAKWKDYRDTHCRAAAGLYAGGSVAGTVGAVCRARLANERAVELKAVYLDWATR